MYPTAQAHLVQKLAFTEEMANGGIGVVQSMKARERD